MIKPEFNQYEEYGTLPPEFSPPPAEHLAVLEQNSTEEFNRIEQTEHELCEPKQKQQPSAQNSSRTRSHASSGVKSFQLATMVVATSVVITVSAATSGGAFLPKLGDGANKLFNTLSDTKLTSTTPRLDTQVALMAFGLLDTAPDVPSLPDQPTLENDKPNNNNSSGETDENGEPELDADVPEVPEVPDVPFEPDVVPDENSNANTGEPPVANTVYPHETTPTPPPVVAHTHSYDAGTVSTPSTCTADGVRTFTCSVCGNTLTEAIAPTGLHKWNGVEITTPATCAADGVRTFTCSVCGNSRTETIAPTGKHTWDSGSTSEPSCSSSGFQSYTCTICGATDSWSISPTGNHSWNAGVVTTAPTCNTEGVKTFTCNVCGNTRTEAIAPTGAHTWNGGVETTAPTCGDEGEKTFTCTVCNSTRIDAILPTGMHSFVNGVCSVCGQISPTIPTNQLVITSAISTNEGTQFSFAANLSWTSTDNDAGTMSFRLELDGTQIDTIVLTADPNNPNIYFHRYASTKNFANAGVAQKLKIIPIYTVNGVSYDQPATTKDFTTRDVGVFTAFYRPDGTPTILHSGPPVIGGTQKVDEQMILFRDGKVVGDVFVTPGIALNPTSGTYFYRYFATIDGVSYALTSTAVAVP